MKLLNLFNFFTRSGREEFAAVSLAVQAVSFLLTTGTLLLVPSSGEMDLAKSIVLVVVGLLNIPVSLVLVWLSLAVFFRRLHDLNLSGWWYVGYLIAVTAGAFVWPQLWWVFTGLGMAVFLALSLKKGTPGPNRFGQEAGPFFPHFFAARSWVLGVLIAGIVIFSLGQTVVSRMQNSKIQTAVFSTQFR